VESSILDRNLSRFRLGDLNHTTRLSFSKLCTAFALTQHRCLID
jgi:hypothetical protein